MAAARDRRGQRATTDTAQPLLASTFYLTRALAPFADVRLGDRGAPQQVITQFLDQKLPMIILADVGSLSPELRERLSAWIEEGGVLVRFAGPRLAASRRRYSVPVKLRSGGRTLGGSLTWEKPQQLASFAVEARSPALPCRRTLPSTGKCWPNPTRRWRPGAGRRWKTARRWSPGERRGKGVVSLFHVSARYALV